MNDWRDKVKQARLPETTVALCLRGDLAAEHEQLTRRLEELRARGPESLAGDGSGQIRERLDEIAAEMRDSVVNFTLRALPRAKRPGDRRPTFRELKEQFQPRERNGDIVREDVMAGFVNALEFPEPLVKASVVEPQLSDEDWDELMPNISDGQFDELVLTAWNLNRGKIDIPFSFAGSAVIPNSELG